MLGSIRKFSTSIYAKILMGIVVIPFVFWGMGSSFTLGSKNVVVVIDKEKHSTQDFLDFIKNFTRSDEKISSNQIEEFLSMYIGEKLIQKEIEHFKIILSDRSLSEIIKHQKDFKRENEFSRVEYEKFLLEKNITAASFETNLANHEKKKQLLNFIGGGIFPSKFLVNSTYNKINQKRNIQFINLNNFFNKKLSFNESEIKTYYYENKDDFKELYKSVKIIELSPKKLINDDEFNDLFFKKIDQIEDALIEGETLSNIVKKFNAGNIDTFLFNESGKDINLKKITKISKELIKNIFALDSSEPTALLEIKNKYFIVEVIKTENIERGIEDENIRKKIILKLVGKAKREFTAEIMSKINQSNFIKSDFDKLSKENDLQIKNVKLENINDNKLLEKDLVNEIYSYPEKKIFVAHDLTLAKNFLIYIDKIENVKINENSDEYKKYLNLSKSEIANELLNTYDDLIKKRHEININYKTLDTVKNYFNQ